MPSVTLPPGCSGLQLEDGTHYRARRPGGRITVSDEHASAIDRIPGNGTAGLVTGRTGHHLGTKTGRWCMNCAPPRLWNAWNDTCPRCGAATEPE